MLWSRQSLKPTIASHLALLACIQSKICFLYLNISRVLPEIGYNFCRPWSECNAFCGSIQFSPTYHHYSRTPKSMPCPATSQRQLRRRQHVLSPWLLDFWPCTQVGTSYFPLSLALVYLHWQADSIVRLPIVRFPSHWLAYYILDLVKIISISAENYNNAFSLCNPSDT